MNITLESSNNNVREDNLLFSEGGSRIIFSINPTKEVQWVEFLNDEINKLNENIFIQKIGFVTEENLIIKFRDKELCNIGVDELTKKFDNSISNYL